jgi:hypothetical protein
LQGRPPSILGFLGRDKQEREKGGGTAKEVVVKIKGEHNGKISWRSAGILYLNPDGIHGRNFAHCPRDRLKNGINSYKDRRMSGRRRRGWRGGSTYDGTGGRGKGELLYAVPKKCHLVTIGGSGAGASHSGGKTKPPIWRRSGDHDATVDPIRGGSHVDGESRSFPWLEHPVKSKRRRQVF